MASLLMKPLTFPLKIQTNSLIDY